MIVELVRRLNPKKVYSAADAQKALETLASSAVDVIVSDIDMPKMDGLEFMRRLAETASRSSVIIVSAIPPALLTATEEMIKAYRINLLGIAQKPVTQDALETLLARYAPAVPAVAQSASGRPFTLEAIIAGLEQGQFEPFFQPRVEVATRRIVGAEALARWCHPEKGVVSPHVFVDALEEAGKVEDLMWVMLEKGIGFCAAAKEAGVLSTLAVKLSPTSLTNPGLAVRLIDMVQGHNIEPNKICFEIAEAAAVTTDAAALENLTRLNLKGFLLAIDDFGTGASTQNDLSRLPFSELKIDRSFVSKAATDKAAKRVLESGVQMAKKLRIKALAEGVETQQDWDLLQELGCDLAQGYFIAKPMAAAAYIDWMRDLVTDPTSIFTT